MLRWLLPALLLSVYAWQSHTYVRVWQSDLTLWAHAAQEAPRKPRPAMNYGLALLKAKRTTEAATVMVHAYELAQAPHIPTWDRQRTGRYVVGGTR